MNEIIIDKLEKYDYAFPIKCFYCGKDTTYMVKKAFKLSKHNKTFALYGECPFCGGPGIAVVQYAFRNTYEVVNIFPKQEAINVYDDLPPKIKEIYTEFAINYNDKQTPITVVSTGRMLIEAILKDIAPQEFNTLGLKNLIKKLADDQIIPKTLYEIAEVIRVIGNKSIHEIEGITQKDAEDIWEFANIFINYIYVLPEKIKRIKDRHS